jgi:site-specific DNA recombinase
VSENNFQITRVALYARVSTEEQREGQTIDSQIAELERFAKEKGWQIAGIYKDEGWSGSILGRPELDHLRDDASKGLFGIVLINDVDRLARDVSHLGIVKRDLERRGVQVVFKKLPSEKSPTYNLMVNILGSFAEFERELIIDRTRRGRRHKVEVRQQFLGTLAPYGYRYVPKDSAANKEGYLTIVPEEAAVVRQMFEWVDKEGLSSHAVVKRLTATKVTPRKGSPQWAKSSVLRILRNETYVGLWHYNKHEACEPARPAKPNKYKRSLKTSNRLRVRTEWVPLVLPDHLRIVEQYRWERVQTQVTQNTTFSLRNTKHAYLLKGLIRCGSCGASYMGDPNHGRFYYRCCARCRKYPAIREDLLNSTVWSAVEEAVLNPSIITDQLATVQKRATHKAEGLKTEGSEIDQALGQVQKEEERLLEAYRTEVLSPAQLGRELEKLTTRRVSLEARKAGLSGQQDKRQLPLIRQSIIDYCRVAAERLRSFTFEERQRFLRLLINEIVFQGDQITIRGVIPISPSREADEPKRAVRTSQPNADFKGGVADIEARCCGRNSVIGNDRVATRLVNPDARNPSYGYNFELVRPVPQRPPPLRQRLDLTLLRSLIEKRPKTSLKQLCDEVRITQGLVLSITAMSRELRRMGFSYEARRWLGPGIILTHTMAA